MAWFRLDASFPEHPKVMGLGLRAEGLFVRGLAYASRVATDGHIPIQFIRSMPDPDVEAVAAALVGAGLWEAAPGGFLIHDYLDYQPSREEVKQRDDYFRDIGQKGGKRSGEVRREAASKRTVEAYGSTDGLKRTVEAQTEKRLNHIHTYIPTNTLDTDVSRGTTSQAKSKTKVQKRATGVPDDLAITDAMRTYAAKKSISGDAVERETERFLDHHRAKGTTMLDWVAGWRTWISRSLDYAPRPTNGRGPGIADGQLAGNRDSDAARYATLRSKASLTRAESAEYDALSKRIVH